jgi:hypothetical protein
MGNNPNSKYEAPRAVHLGDAKTAKLECVNGPTGTPDVCGSGFSAQGNVCNRGSRVVH